MSFLTPVAALFGVLAAVPLAVFAGRRRRAAQVRRMLRLEQPARRPWGLFAICLAAVPVLVGVAAAQPVDHEHAHRAATQRRGGLRRPRHLELDAGVVRIGEPSPFERAQEDVARARGPAARGSGRTRLAHRPCAAAPVPDRDQRVFRETIREALGIERPPPSTSFGTNVTTLDALGAVPTLEFFTPRPSTARSSSSPTGRASRPAPINRLRAGRTSTSRSCA